MRKKIQDGVDEYQAMDGHFPAVSPSAPLPDTDDLAPSVPTAQELPGRHCAPTVSTFQSSECVICMERKVNILNILCEAYEVRFDFVFPPNNYNPLTNHAASHTGEDPSYLPIFS